MQRFDVVVIGQGYAGLTAARLAALRDLRTANFEARSAGGLIVNMKELDPVPPNTARSGEEVVGDITTQGATQGVVQVLDAVTKVARTAEDQWQVTTDAGSYVARNVVVASGARLRKLGVPGEGELQGVSECADCDGPMVQGLETVVVGGGDSAFQEALALAHYAAKVTIVMRGKGPRARPEWVERVAGNPKLSVLSDTRVVAILGDRDKGVSGVRIVTAGRSESMLPCAGVFIFVGLEPNTSFLPDDVPRDGRGALITSDQCATSLPGLWAIGAVRSRNGGTLSDAAEDARRAVDALA